MDFLFQIPLVISYYTKGTPYEEIAKGLITSCTQFQLDFHIEEIENRGSWEENCAYKPYYIKEKMEEFKRPILWVDVDAIFLQPMKREDFMLADFSALYDLEDKDPRFSAFSGTVYINSTIGGLKALDLWCFYSDEILQREGKFPAYSDQASLYFSILSKPDFLLSNLPPQYAKIFDRKVEGLASKEVVIEHYQASRKVRTQGILDVY